MQKPKNSDDEYGDEKSEDSNEDGSEEVSEESETGFNDTSLPPVQAAVFDMRDDWIK